MNGLAISLILLFVSILIVGAGVFFSVKADKLRYAIIGYAIAAMFDLSAVYFFLMFVISLFQK